MLPLNDTINLLFRDGTATATASEVKLIARRGTDKSGKLRLSGALIHALGTFHTTKQNPN